MHPLVICTSTRLHYVSCLAQTLSVLSEVVLIGLVPMIGLRHECRILQLARQYLDGLEREARDHVSVIDSVDQQAVLQQSIR